MPNSKRFYIQELQRYLYGLSYYDETIPRIIPDGIYGKETAISVRAFQQKHGLRPTGETNCATWDAIVSEYRKNVERVAAAIDIFPKDREKIAMDESGLIVYIIQAMLKTLQVKYDEKITVEITGIYDAQTKKAVQKFQECTYYRRNTGFVDRYTWNLLVAANNVAN